jgi:serine/threonine protein kinase
MPARLESQAEPIPGYRLIERLGGGGFGEVWKAEAPGGLLKAIKFVYGDLATVNDGEAARAEQELKALSRVKSVRHPFILSLERFDIIDGQLIIVSELADRSLWDRFRECRNQGLPGIPRGELMRYMEETAEALDHMNLELDLMHLDIKPQNLFLVGSHIKVADFGLVKDLEGLVASVTGGVTPVYAAPETFEGYVSRFSDQYSTAIVYMELLTGKRPFSSANTRQLILQHLREPPDLSELLPADRPVIERALAKKPEERFPNTQELVQALYRANDGSYRPRYVPELQDTPFGAPLTTWPPGQACDPGVPRGTEASEANGHSGPLTPTSVSPTKPYRTPFQPATTEPPPEVTGDGSLVPALLVGLGQIGRTVLEQIRHELRERYGDLSRLPHLRLLSIDTDPSSHAPLVAPEPLAADETLLARLNRPSRYIRSRDALPPVEKWLDPKMLYRIPRELVTSGIRALGRLAFIDNYRSIVSRLRWELELILQPEALSSAAQNIGQRLRSNWPRVYVIASLGGGAGSGMLLDLAYTTRALLRGLGFARQEVISLLALPPAEAGSASDLGLANAHAGLMELKHYMSPGVTFQAQYEARENPIVDAGPPFTRCLFLPSGREDEPAELVGLVRSIASWLHQELLTPLGRTMHAFRSDPQNATAMWSRFAATPDSSHATFGVRSVSLPRRDLLRGVARTLCKSLTVQWTRKTPPEALADLKPQIQQHCCQLALDPPAVLQSLIEASTEKLGNPPDVVFGQWLKPFQQPSRHGLPEPSLYRTLLQVADSTLGVLDPQSIKEGTQTQTVLGDCPSVLPAVLRERAEAMVRAVEPQLIEHILGICDHPGKRLGAAEEAINLATACLEEWLKGLEDQQDQVAIKLIDAVERIQQEFGECERAYEKALRGSRPSQSQRHLAAVALPERIHRFVIHRFQYISLQWALTVYRSLRGRLSDQKKEVGYCRYRLHQLHGMFEAGAANQTAQDCPSHSIMLPQGCQSLAESVDRCLQAVSDADWDRLDQEVQRAIAQEFRGLHHACTLSGHQHLERLRTVMLREAERFLDERLEFDDAAALLLACTPPGEPLDTELATLHAEAAPEFTPDQIKGCRAIDVLCAPATPAGETLADAARRVVPGLRSLTDIDPEEILFYREVVGISIDSLPQFGPIGRQAYESACAIEHFTPHSRIDVEAWRPVATQPT